MGLNELMKDDYDFCLEHCWFLMFHSGYKEPLSFLPKLSITCSNLVDYTFVNKNEIFIFSP